MLSMFKKDPKEKTKVEFSALSSSEKEIVKSAYDAYFELSDKKIWTITGEPVHLDPNLEEVNKHYKHIADGWTAFVLCISQKNDDEALHGNKIKEAFEAAYKISAKSYSENKIPDFDSLAEIEKAAWTAAAQSAHDANLVTCSATPSPK